MAAQDPKQMPVADLAGGAFSTFALEDADDNRKLKWALVVAAVLHGILFLIRLPEIAEAAFKAPEKPKVYVVQQLRFKPPPPQQQQELLKPRAKKVPIPDPTPDEPEPIRVVEEVRGTRVSKLLGPFRRMPPVNLQALEEVLLRVSELVCELPWIEELDINPLIVDENGAIAADARIIVGQHAPVRGRYGHMATHPYPSRLISTWQPPEGELVTLRPIRPEDAEIEQAFVRRLSPESRRFRFMDTLRELTPTMLVRFTQIDYDREMAFVATVQRDGKEVEVGVCRYITNQDGVTCEYAIVIADDWHRRGLGRRMMAQLIEVARRRGLAAMIGHVMSSNRGMLELCQELGFVIADSSDDPMVKRVTLALKDN